MRDASSNEYSAPWKKREVKVKEAAEESKVHELEAAKMMHDMAALLAKTNDKVSEAGLANLVDYVKHW